MVFSYMQGSCRGAHLMVFIGLPFLENSKSYTEKLEAVTSREKLSKRRAPLRVHLRGAPRSLSGGGAVGCQRPRERTEP